MLENFSTVLLVVAVALIRADGCVLMQRRRVDAAHGGLWEFPGGKVEPGEGAEQAAVREIAEELELDLAPQALAPVGFASAAADGTPGSRPIVILLFSCREWRGEPRSREGESLVWLAPEEIPALAMPPLDYPLARVLQSVVAR